MGLIWLSVRSSSRRIPGCKVHARRHGRHGVTDAINAILGLDALTAADKRLLAAARPLNAAVKNVRTRRVELARVVLMSTTTAPAVVRKR